MSGIVDKSSSAAPQPEEHGVLVTRHPDTCVPAFHGDPFELIPQEVLMIPIVANTYAIRYGSGLVVIDPGLFHTGQTVKQAIERWYQLPITHIFYTHGHVDHALGTWALLDEHPDCHIVANQRVRNRFDRYKATAGYNGIINQRQFQLHAPFFPTDFHYPTMTVPEQTHQELQLQSLHFHLYTARGETDDALWLFVEPHRWLFTGDFVIWSSPNCGNPQKVQRYALEWADALKQMVKLQPTLLCPGHGPAVHGTDAICTMLNNTIAFLTQLHSGTLERMNQGVAPEDIIHQVRIRDDNLLQLPYLDETYDMQQFVVRNILRLNGGWWDGNPAHLLPVPPKELASEVVKQTGGKRAIVRRINKLVAKNSSKLAAHWVEWLWRKYPKSKLVARTRVMVYEARMAEENSLMAHGIYRNAINEAKQVLGLSVEGNTSLSFRMKSQRQQRRRPRSKL